MENEWKKRPGLRAASSCFEPVELNDIEWIEVDSKFIEGRGWESSETEAPFDRVPLRVKEELPGVWGLGQSSTGEYFDFETDSTAVVVRTLLEKDAFGENNFNKSAFSGVDLYVWDSNENRWRWAAAAQHFVKWSNDVTYSLVWNMPAGKRRFRMYLPLRNRLLKLFIGVDEGAKIELLPRAKVKNIVYYGTSIIHGAFSVRAGLCLTSRLNRTLGRPVVNLGFSGAACLEPEMAELLSELDPAVYICDPYHNVWSGLVSERMERFFDILCTKRPGTPVVLVSAPPVFNDFLYPDCVAEDTNRTRLFHDISKTLSAKYSNFHFVPGEDFYSDETSIDGVHPNDEAFGSMAKILTPVIAGVMNARSL